MEHCPAALQLAFSQANLHLSTPLTAHDGNLRDPRRRHDGADAGCPRGHIQQYFKAKSQEGPPRGSLSGDTRCNGQASEDGESLHSLSLRHESQLQAQASTDQFLWFFQMNPKGILPALLNRTASWKQEMEKSQTQKPLRVALFQQVCQTVLDRMLTFAKLSQTSPEWDQAIQGQLITAEGTWPFLQWCPESKSLKATPKPGISMIKMQKHLEDLVEAAQSDHNILRFKALKNTSGEIKHQQICPFLLHISLRESTIWEVLNMLAHNSFRPA